MTTKANRTLGYIRRNIRTKHKAIRQTAYQTLVRPQLEYAFPVWSPHADINVSKIEAVQRRAARWVTRDSSSYSSMTQMINTLEWWTSESESEEQRRADAHLLMFYKIVHGLTANLYSTTYKNYKNNTYVQFYSNPDNCKLLQMFFFPFSNRAVEQPPSLGCPIRRPDLSHTLT